MHAYISFTCQTDIRIRKFLYKSIYFLCILSTLTPSTPFEKHIDIYNICKFLLVLSQYWHGLRQAIYYSSCLSTCFWWMMMNPPSHHSPPGRRENSLLSIANRPFNIKNCGLICTLDCARSNAKRKFHLYVL